MNYGAYLETLRLGDYREGCFFLPKKEISQVEICSGCPTKDTIEVHRHVNVNEIGSSQVCSESFDLQTLFKRGCKAYAQRKPVSFCQLSTGRLQREPQEILNGRVIN